MFKQQVLFTKEECREILNQIEEVKQAKVVSERGASGYGKSFRKSKIAHFNSDKVKEIILPKISSIDSTIIFDSTCKHEVTPMLKGERYALVCWLEKNNLHYKQTII